MNTAQLINTLNWFYSLELNQVDLYASQAKAFSRSYGVVFERVAYIEQQHVDNIAGKIKDLGGKPSVIGDIVSPILGSLGGGALSLTGLQHTLEANILLESKAMKDYRKLISDLTKTGPKDTELLKILLSNFIDEDLHTEWFAAQLNRLNTHTGIQS